MTVQRSASIAAVGAATAVLAVVGSATGCPASIDARTRSLLRSSAVPVLLPASLPKAIGTIASVTVISADRDGYYVGFSPVRGCSGARSCAILHVGGYRHNSPAGHAYGRDRRVRLPGGALGFYSSRDCSGESCTEATLTFEHAGSIYEIDANVARDNRPILIRLYQTLRPLTAPARRGHGR